MSIINYKRGKIMKKLGLIGYPLGHSMSPVIHKELLKLNGIEGSYELKEINPQDFENGLNSIASLDGFNVTIPHKINIIPYLDGISKRAELFGAVNTVEIKNGKKIGHNTDCEGFLRAIKTAGISLDGRVLVCGSGGVSRMFAFESVLAGADLTIAVRQADVTAAQEIQQEIKDKLSKPAKVITFDEVDGEYDVLINGTPVGMYPNTQECILPKDKLKSFNAVFDAVYNPLATKLVEYAKELGLKYSNGLPMLVWQAAVAQEIWFGVKFTQEQINGIIKITERELMR